MFELHIQANRVTPVFPCWQGARAGHQLHHLQLKVDTTEVMNRGQHSPALSDQMLLGHYDIPAYEPCGTGLLPLLDIPVRC